jgi:hypothetical protein
LSDISSKALNDTALTLTGGTMATTGQTPFGFFSYSRKDSEFVLRLAKDLRHAGAVVWLDQLDIKPGEHWDGAVEKALATCDRMLVILSPDSVNSTNVMDDRHGWRACCGGGSRC